jgi:hypothetical protein
MGTKNKKKTGQVGSSSKAEAEAKMKKQEESESSDDDISSEEEGEDLILEGVLVRNEEVESSSDEEDEDEDSDDEGPQKKKVKLDKKAKNAASNKQKKNSGNNNNKSKKEAAAAKKNELEIVNVEFTFNDLKEAYFHGMKNFLLNQPAYASNSSALSDLIIENISVGTVVSTEDGEDNVFGFASVLNVTTYGEKPCIQFLKKKCLDSCPAAHKNEMKTVLSGKTKRPAGILLHGRMVNLPLEITHVLHEQLVHDMDWAVDNAEGGEAERKSLNFGAFILMAPCTRDGTTHSTIYKNFDDEIFAGCAEFVFPMNMSGLANKGEGKNDNEGENHHVDVVVMTKEGHRKAMKELKVMIQG